MAGTYESLAKMIDHALLQPSLTVDELESGLETAVAYGCASVCIMPHYLERAASRLEGTGVKASTTVGFPHGGQRTDVKVYEAQRALADGGEELDMVVNVNLVKSGRWDEVKHDVRAVVDLVHAARQKVKVIFENALLDDDEKVRLCHVCNEVGADWAKTSTGFASGGATVEDLTLMLKHCRAPVQVKAAGGVRDLATLKQCHDMGVTRVGMSRTAEVLDAWRVELGMEPIGLSASAGY
ncbi:MAG: deoxyribose-phosphate aldolase [Fimbriimonadaceae bacterium]|nr:deoxyribose-phosphate aldolase [Fimbriimonadaceae bacterium]